MSSVIAIFGNDGAGKSTLVRCMLQQLAENGTRTRLIDKWDVLQAQRHPNCASFLKDDLPSLRVAISRMPALPRLLFLFWCISAAMENMWHGNPDVILLDGYWMKHAAAEIAMGQDEALVLSLAGAMAEPDLQIYLDIDPGTAFSRKQGWLTPYECGCDQTLAPSAFLRHQAAVRAILQRWAADAAIRIDASQPPPAVLALALAAVREQTAMSGAAAQSRQQQVCGNLLSTMLLD